MAATFSALPAAQASALLGAPEQTRQQQLPWPGLRVFPAPALARCLAAPASPRDHDGCSPRWPGANGVAQSRRSSGRRRGWNSGGDAHKRQGRSGTDAESGSDRGVVFGSPGSTFAQQSQGRFIPGAREGLHGAEAMTEEAGAGALSGDPGVDGSAGAGAVAGVVGSGEGVAVAAGEDAAAFAWEAQSLVAWGAFTGVLGVVLAVLYAVWVSPQGGWGEEYVEFFRRINPNSEVQMALMLLLFALVHSGGAALRPKAEELLGPRVYRVLYAGVSLPLAVSAVVFFVNHRYDGTVLWQLRGVPGVHELVWALSLLSFFFLYPSTFNLLEVAAVDTPRVHLWGTGIARITRHPQMWGQLVWCVAHMMWIGSSFTAVTSAMLCLHHAFGVWHGEQRLAAKYGDQFKQIQASTSIIPFAAILEGRQRVPADYWREFVRLPYIAVLAFTLGTYFAHPYIIRAAFWVHW